MVAVKRVFVSSIKKSAPDVSTTKTLPRFPFSPPILVLSFLPPPSPNTDLGHTLLEHFLTTTPHVVEGVIGEMLTNREVTEKMFVLVDITWTYGA